MTNQKNYIIIIYSLSFPLRLLQTGIATKESQT